jgi:pectate lyase
VVPAFPSAEGYGMWATGGRGGMVVEVTNLLDDAAGTTEGSLRWALKQYSSSPLTVVFRVSGVIQLVADLRVNRSYGTTIAGQTAPGDGICIRGAKCNFGGCKNLVIRHLRFRIGLKGDTLFAPGGSIGIENASDWIIDHCTFGWSGEENMTIYDNNNTTVQWCILHEGLYACGHAKGARSYGSQWGGQTATYHHNLLAHNVSRTPRFNGARSNDINVLIDYVNNVNYNWGKQNSCYGGDIENRTHRVNFVNNY